MSAFSVDNSCIRVAAVETVSSDFIVGITKRRYLDAEESIVGGNLSGRTVNLLANSKGRRPPSFDTFHASMSDVIKHDTFFRNIDTSFSNKVLIGSTDIDSRCACSVGQ